jgi:hypothetical protein
MGLVTITWYDGKIMEAVLPYDFDTIHSMCMSLDNNTHVRQWCLLGHSEGSFPFYKVKFWNKLIIKVSEWDYSQ